MKRNFKEIAIDRWSRMRLRWPTLWYGAVPLIVMASFSVSSVIGYVYTSSNLTASRELVTRQQLKEHNLLISAQLYAYASVLKGSAADMEVAGATEHTWDDFISVYNLKENFPDIAAIAVAKGMTSQTNVYTYIAPMTTDTRSLIDQRPAQNPKVAAAMEKALYVDHSTLTGAISGMFSTKANITDRAVGFSLVKPYYDISMPIETLEERRNALRGYTIGLFRGDEFFDSLYRNVGFMNKAIEIYLGDPKPENLVYRTDNTNEVDKTTHTQKIKLYGQDITLVYTQDTSKIVPYSVTYLPQYLLLIGLGVFFGLLSGFVFRNRYRTLMKQKERDVNFAKDELLSLASHQLRTPATGVKQYLGMVLQGFSGDITELQRKYLEQAYRSNNRQLHIINDILHLAKLESGRIVLAEHKFDFVEMIRDVVDEQKTEAENGDVILKLNAPSSGLMYGDSHMLRMVVENLISNAIKYTEPQGVVAIRLSKRGMHWVLTVKDTGVGIAKNDIDKLFKQFSRIANSRSDYVTGTGIGLYLAHHLVVLHGGTISVTSQEKKGSTFIVRLPRKM